MNAQAGFSLTEMLAAIFVLSLGAVATSETISGLFGGWERTENSLERSTRLSAVLDQVSEAKSAPIGSEVLKFELSHDTEVVLANPRLDRDASCRFDLVARRCR